MVEETAATGNVKLTDKNYLSLLHLALSIGVDDLARSLVKRGADINLQALPFDGFFHEGTPLFFAALLQTPDLRPIPSFQRREMVDFLLENGADIKFLLNKKLPVTILGVVNFIHARGEGNSDKSGVQKEDAEVFLIYLLQRGAPQAWDIPNGGETAHILKIAIAFNMPHVVAYLLDHGVDTSILSVDEREKWKKMWLRDSKTLCLPKKGGRNNL